MDKQEERMRNLIEIGRQVGTAADLRSVFQLVLEAAVKLTNSSNASILEIGGDGQSLRFLASLPELNALRAIPVPVENSLAGMVFRQKKTASISDVSNTPLHFKSVDEISGFHTRSLLACPILFKGEALGVMEVVNKVNSPDYNGDDATILETLSTYVALAVQNMRLQALLEKTQSESRRLEKMKNDFIAITSHELRTPLGLILGHSTFLRELVSEPEYHSQLDTIIKNAMRLKEIIASMTSVDNIQSGRALVRKRSVSIRQLISEVIGSVREEAEAKQVILGMDLEDPDLTIEGDPEKLKIALLNLVRNGVTFTNAGGHVFVAAEKAPGYIKIAVIDDGVGIPLKDLPHIFERFYQVESHLTRKHGGMGVGLSVARMNIELHGGRIWVESSEGKGSIFTIVLPLYNDDSQPA